MNEHSKIGQNVIEPLVEQDEIKIRTRCLGIVNYHLIKSSQQTSVSTYEDSRHDTPKILNHIDRYHGINTIFERPMPFTSRDNNIEIDN